jgi:hypothetical protein
MLGEKEALMVAGCAGGPFTIWMYTPLRNAITLGSQAPNAVTHPASGLYREVFSRGFVGGWTGCVTTVCMSSVQFMCMGPLYHAYTHYLGAVAAVPLTSVSESLITYGSQTRNAQMAYNVTVPAARRLVVQNPLNPFGVGFAMHAARNTIAMTGSRLIVGPCTSAISAATTAAGAYPGKGACEVAGDFSGCVVAAAFSMPLNQCFNFLVTARPAALEGGIVRSCTTFLKTQYIGPKGGLSRTVARDVFMRCAYIAPQLTTYLCIERALLSYARAGKEEAEK